MILIILEFLIFEIRIIILVIDIILLIVIDNTIESFVTILLVDIEIILLLVFGNNIENLIIVVVFFFIVIMIIILIIIIIIIFRLIIIIFILIISVNVVRVYWVVIGKMFEYSKYRIFLYNIMFKNRSMFNLLVIFIIVLKVFLFVDVNN